MIQHRPQDSRTGRRVQAIEDSNDLGLFDKHIVIQKQNGSVRRVEGLGDSEIATARESEVLRAAHDPDLGKCRVDGVGIRRIGAIIDHPDTCLDRSPGTQLFEAEGRLVKSIPVKNDDRESQSEIPIFSFNLSLVYCVPHTFHGVADIPHRR